MAASIPTTREARQALSSTDARRTDVQRRRREVALTATWLRELRAVEAARSVVRTATGR